MTRSRFLAFILGFTLVSLGSLPIPLALAETTVDLSTAMSNFHGQSIWPVDASDSDDIISTFGPRIQSSTETYDWHRGVDIDAAEGTPVLAAIIGTLFKVTDYTNGGTTVILKHTFSDPTRFHGQTLTSFYTLYMHLSGVDATLLQAAATGEHPTVTAGETIGWVGHSGTASSDHLHFELRVGTWCSLEYQLAHPESSCAGYKFDPHVHPLLLYNLPSTRLKLTRRTTSGDNAIVRLAMVDDAPLLKRVKISAKNRHGQTIARQVFNFNTRKGFDASSDRALNTVDTSKPYLSPVPFGANATHYKMDIVIPAQWLPASAKQFTITATNIWGKTTSKTFKR